VTFGFSLLTPNNHDRSSFSKAHGLQPVGFKTPAQKTSLSGFARVARQVSSWTSRGILTVVILAAGLVFGREILRWWGADAEVASRPPQDVDAGEGMGDPAQPLRLQFGDQNWSFTQRTLVGTGKEVAATLRAGCRQAMRSAADPGDPPGPAEQHFLRTLAGSKPVEEAGQSQLYELEGAFPMVAGVRQVRSEDSGTALSPVPPAAPPPQLTRRVVTWSLAVPKGGNSWISYDFHRTPPREYGNESPPEVMLPPGASRTVAIWGPGGGGMLSFRGPPEVESWKQFFDSWLAKHQWKVLSGWQQYGSNWGIRGEKSPPGRGETVEIHFGPDGRGGQTGLLVLTPAAGSSERK
jgi:hypothetical protein